MTVWLQRIVRDPLVHFAMLGTAIFAAWSWLGDGGVGEPEVARHIVIDAAEQKLLVAYFAAQWRRPPSPAEFRELIERRVRDEVLMREAVALGLDRNDRVIRQRLAQKLETTLQELAAVAAPDEETLRRFHATRAGQYTRPALVSFEHHFLDRLPGKGRHPEPPGRLAEDHRAALRAGDAPPADPFHAPVAFTDLQPAQLTRVFGAAFRDELLRLAAQASAGDWLGPVKSPWGLHLVRVDRFQPAEDRAFEQVRETVLSDWRRTEIARAQAERIDAMVADYTVQLAPFSPPTAVLP